uniref:Uncharacterized protein n=1 Tax=Anguilla anguilla TaxID=7936 RepID=A0A0E9TFW4_ANGAN
MYTSAVFCLLQFCNCNCSFFLFSFSF